MNLKLASICFLAVMLAGFEHVKYRVINFRYHSLFIIQHFLLLSMAECSPRYNFLLLTVVSLLHGLGGGARRPRTQEARIGCRS